MRSILVLLLSAISMAHAEPPAGFRPRPWFSEFVREYVDPEGVRVLMTVPGQYDPKKPTRLIIYATPNGNTIEWTNGRERTEKEDWHFDIQHVAAQVRKYASLRPNENVVWAVTEAEGLSWPSWKKRTADGPQKIRRLIDQWNSWLPSSGIKVTLTGHSGGGSFLFGLIDSGEAIPEDVDRIAFLDANYSYSGPDGHAKKLLAWLNGNDSRRLIVIAYDDREIMLDGKKVVGPDGGTFRATKRMRLDFERDTPFLERKTGPFEWLQAKNGQITFYTHPNPENKILHTALVGEMNGLLRALTDENMPDWGSFGGPIAYRNRIQPKPEIPAAAEQPIGGAAFAERLPNTLDVRELTILRTFCQGGGLPPFLHTFKPITVTVNDRAGKPHTCVFEVMPDYLSVGTDGDFFRVPMTPRTALMIADQFDCTLPTRKMADDIFRAATVKLAPRPMTENRESPATFLQHNRIVEEQRKGKAPGELVAGIKKDVVVTNRLGEKANRVAIYGWHFPDGKPIQPLNVNHVNTYVDYSHGIRFVKRTVRVDGKPRDIRQVLQSPDLCGLLSDEGPISFPGY